MLIALLLTIQYFLICSINFIILRNIRLHLLFISVICSAFFSFVYLQFGIISTGLLWVCLVSINYVLTKSELHSSLISSSFSFLLFIFSDYLTLFINPIFDTHLSEYQRFFWTIISFLVLSSLIIILINRNKLFKNELFLPIGSLVSTGTFLIHFIVITVERYATDQQDMQTVNSYFVIGYSLTSLFVASLLVFIAKNHYKDKEKENYLHYLTQYANDIEKKYAHLRSFKHDYKNILVSMENFIEQGNINELKEYFETQIKGTSDTIFDNSLELAQLENLNVLSVKSIFLSKLNSVDTKKTKVSILVFERVENIDIDDTLLVRSLGIILDNALEATLNEEQKNFIECAVIKDCGKISFVISNSISEPLPPLYKLKATGYSSKGGNRGLGLSNLDKLVELEPRLSLETTIFENKFCQILSVNTGGTNDA